MIRWNFKEMTKNIFYLFFAVLEYSFLGQIKCFLISVWRDLIQQFQFEKGCSNYYSFEGSVK